jgi:hypothetical protein
MFGVLLSLMIAAMPLATEAQLLVEPSGACLVIHIEGNTIPSAVRARCAAIQKPSYPNGSSFQQLYSWVPTPLAAAYNEAERGIGGRVTGITGTGEVRIIVYPEALVNAGIGIDQFETSGSNVDIFLNSGLIDFVEATVSAYMVDALQGTSDAVPGLGFRQWLMTMPPPKGTPLSRWSVRWPGPNTPPSLEWNLKYIRTPAHWVYTFVFAHELSHIALNLPSGGATPSEALQRESRVDLNAFHDIGVASPNANAMMSKGALQPTFIMVFLAASARFEHLRNDIIVSSLHGPAGSSVTDIAPARNWIFRADALMRQWQADCQGKINIAMCPSGVDKLYADAQQLLDLSH